MSTCGSCVCSSPARTCSTGRLVLATQVDHTATALRSLALRRGTPLRAAAPGLLELRAGDLDTLARSLGNGLTPVTEDLVPEVRALEKALLRAGALGAAMSGTGTAVFGIFASEAEARAAVDGLRAAFAAVCEPVPWGVKVF